MSQTTKNLLQSLILFVSGTIIIIFLYVYFLVKLELEYLNVYIAGIGGIQLDDWVDKFRYLTINRNMWTAIICVFLWYVYGQFICNLNEWQKSKQFVKWFLLFVVTVGSVVVAIYETPVAEEGLLLAYSFYFINSSILYYIITLLFSPPSFKYTPPLARFVRHW